MRFRLFDKSLRVVPSQKFPRTWTWVWVRDGDEKMWRHIFVTKRHIPGSMRRCQVLKKVLLVLPKMWRFSWNLVQMWRFRHIVTLFSWVRLGINLSFKTLPFSVFLVFSNFGLKRPKFQKNYKRSVHSENDLDVGFSRKSVARKSELHRTRSFLLVRFRPHKSPFRLICTANFIWGDIFESSKLKAGTSLLPRFSEKRR